MVARSSDPERELNVMALVEASGLASLTQISSIAEKAEVLTRLRKLSRGLDPLTRALLRDEAIAELKGCHVPSAARLVDVALAGQGAEATTTAQGSAVAFLDPPAWPDPVGGAELLAELVGTLHRHVILAEAAAVAVALWILHTHALDAAHISPRLAILSPAKRCGKTTLLKLLQACVRRPLPSANLTAAVLFRSVEAFAPTLLIDEADTFVRGREDLLGVFNAGHDRQSATVLRCVGDDHEPRAFRVWAPVAIAAIGELPETLMDRSVVVSMKRKRSADAVLPLRRTDREALRTLQRKCARWARDHLDAARAAHVAVPRGLHDRAADNWEPLLALAHCVGSPWIERAEEAAAELCIGTPDQSESIAEVLLMDIRQLFRDGRMGDAVTMKELVAALIGLDERPWAEFRHGQALSTHQLGRLLRRFGVAAKPMRDGSSVAKGYRREAFADAFARYLPDEPVTPVTRADSLSVCADSAGLQGPFVTESESAASACGSAHVTDVTGAREHDSSARANQTVFDALEEAIEERAAILEFEAGFSREQAELRARAEFGPRGAA